MENLFFLKIEIVIFVISFFYAIYYIVINIKFFLLDYLGEKGLIE